MITEMSGWACRVLSSIRSGLESDSGASLVEYALLVGLIALVCIIAMIYFGNSVSSSFSHTGSAVGAAH